MPHSIEVNNRTITDPKAMNNVFNNYFTTIDKKTNSNIKFSPKHYIDYLSCTNTNTFFLTPIDTNETSFIISKSIPAKILKLLKNFISQHLSEIFNMSFPTGQFSSVMKTAKVIAIHKKQSKVDYTNYGPISLLSNIEKSLKNLCTKGYLIF